MVLVRNLTRTILYFLQSLNERLLLIHRVIKYILSGDENKLKKLFILAVLLLLLVACQGEEKELLFKGSSENWSANLVVSVINGSEKKQLEIRYDGNNMNSIESFDYFVENSNSETTFGAENVNLDKDGFYSNNDLSSNSPSTTLEDTINITINWNGQSESFEVKKK